MATRTFDVIDVTEILLHWHGDVDGGFAGGPVDVAFGVVPGHGALDDAGADAGPPGGHEADEDWPADLSGQVGDGACGDARGQDDPVPGGVQGGGEAGPVRVGAGNGRGGVGDGGAQGLVGDEQSVDLLLDAVGGAGAQHAAAEDGGLELDVGDLDLPSFVVRTARSPAG